MDCRQKLACCTEGAYGKIVELATADRKILGKLMSLGILPGATFRLLRCHPGFLLQTGHTKVALDSELANHIFVENE
jgi:Fe2+ transport system protein FeoA